MPTPSSNHHVPTSNLPHYTHHNAIDAWKKLHLMSNKDHHLVCKCLHDTILDNNYIMSYPKMKHRFISTSSWDVFKLQTMKTVLTLNCRMKLSCETCLEKAGRAAEFFASDLLGRMRPRASTQIENTLKLAHSTSSSRPDFLTLSVAMFFLPTWITSQSLQSLCSRRKCHIEC